MNPKEVLDSMTAQPVTGADAHTILEVLGDDGTRGTQLERALKSFAKDVISDIERQHAGNVRNADAELESRAAEITEAFDEVEQAVRLTARDLDAGRIDAKTARKRLAKADETRRTLQGRVEQLEADNAATQAFAEQDPAEWQQEMLGRYPELRKRLPVASIAELSKRA